MPTVFQSKMRILSWAINNVIYIIDCFNLSYKMKYDWFTTFSQHRCTLSVPPVLRLRAPLTIY